MLSHSLIAFALISHVGGEITNLPHIGNFLAMIILMVYFISFAMEKKP